MNRFRNILAVYNDAPGADDVLVQAVALARANGARLTVVDTHENPKSAWLVEEARRRLRRIIPWITQEGVSEVTTDVLVGTPYVEIIRRVLCEEHDLVIVSVEGGTAFKDVFLGSTATNLLLKCPSAVWLLKPGQSIPCSNIVAALNPRPDESRNDDINVKILELATTVAQGEDARLHLVHFWEVEGEDGEIVRSELAPEPRKQLLDKHKTARQRTLSALLARCATRQLQHEIHLPRGRPRLHMSDLATRLAADVIVMGTASRVGLSRLLMGNFAETVLGGVRCSVLAVKPDEFSTPVVLPHHDDTPQLESRASVH